MPKEFHTKHKPYYIVLAAFICVTAASGIYVFNDAYSPTTEKAEQVTSTNSAEIVYSSVDKNENLTTSTILSEELPINENESVIESSQDNITSPIEEDTPSAKPESPVQNLPEPRQDQPTQEPATTSKTEQIPTIEATLIVQGTSNMSTIAEASNVYDLMMDQQANGHIQFVAKDFGGQLGIFIDSINGVQSGNDEYYWFYYINGQKAKMGISHYTLTNGDIIEWKYEKNTF